MTHHTEQEAREKWCPFARVLMLDDGPAGYNRADCKEGPATDAMCIASDCMAWRGADHGSKLVEKTEDEDGNVTFHHENTGYCGLTTQERSG